MITTQELADFFASEAKHLEDLAAINDRMVARYADSETLRQKAAIFAYTAKLLVELQAKADAIENAGRISDVEAEALRKPCSLLNELQLKDAKPTVVEPGTETHSPMFVDNIKGPKQ